MSAFSIITAIAVWVGAMCAVVAMFSIARYFLIRRRQSEVIREGAFRGDSAVPILRWNLRKRPAAENRRSAGVSLDNMSETGLTSEMIDVLRERNPFAGRAAARILGHMRIGERRTAHT